MNQLVITLSILLIFYHIYIVFFLKTMEKMDNILKEVEDILMPLVLKQSSAATYRMEYHSCIKKVKAKFYELISYSKISIHSVIQIELLDYCTLQYKECLENYEKNKNNYELPTSPSGGVNTPEALDAASMSSDADDITEEGKSELGGMHDELSDEGKEISTTNDTTVLPSLRSLRRSSTALIQSIGAIRQQGNGVKVWACRGTRSTGTVNYKLDFRTFILGEKLSSMYLDFYIKYPIFGNILLIQHLIGVVLFQVALGGGIEETYAIIFLLGLPKIIESSISCNIKILYLLLQMFEVWFFLFNTLIFAIYGSLLTQHREDGWSLAIGYTMTSLTLAICMTTDTIKPR